MSLGFYMDHQVHGAITRGLRRRGVIVTTADEDGASRCDDEVLLTRATTLGRVLVTYDSDFLRITTRWLADGRSFHGMVFIYQGRTTVRHAIDDLVLISDLCSPQDMHDHIEYLPL